MISLAEIPFLSRLEFETNLINRGMSLSMSSSSSAAAAASTPKSSSSPAAASSTTSWFSGIVRGRGDKPNPAKLSKSASATGIGSGDYGGPIKGKNQFRGVLFKYGPRSIQVQFCYLRLLLSQKETTFFISSFFAAFSQFSSIGFLIMIN